MLFLIVTLFALAQCQEVDQSIVGGSSASISEFPHQLSLRVYGSHTCGASLVSSTRSVTAAHCIGSPVSAYTVLGGTTDRTVTSCSTCKYFAPSDIVRNPSFVNSGNYPNDIAVIKHAAQSFNSNFSPITMATSAQGDFANQVCQITGWGNTCGSCGLSQTLKKASMNVMSNPSCQSIWGTNMINSGQVCILSSSASSCQGDSGGPLTCGKYLVGASSWAASGCPVNYPVVYTRISYFYNWIVAQ